MAFIDLLTKDVDERSKQVDTSLEGLARDSHVMRSLMGSEAPSVGGEGQPQTASSMIDRLARSSRMFFGQNIKHEPPVPPQQQMMQAVKQREKQYRAEFDQGQTGPIGQVNAEGAWPTDLPGASQMSQLMSTPTARTATNIGLRLEDSFSGGMMSTMFPETMSKARQETSTGSEFADTMLGTGEGLLPYVNPLAPITASIAIAGSVASSAIKVARGDESALAGAADVATLPLMVGGFKAASKLASPLLRIAGMAGVGAGTTAVQRGIHGELPSVAEVFGGAIGGAAGGIGHHLPGVREEAPAQQSFVEQVTPYAERASQATGIPTDVIVGQWAHESNFGTSHVAETTGNLAGIKTPGAAASGAETYQPFGDMGAFTDKYISMINHSRYDNVRDIAKNGGSAKEIGDALHQAGYAEDPHYGDKLAARTSQVAGDIPAAQATQTNEQPAPAQAATEAPEQQAARANLDKQIAAIEQQPVAAQTAPVDLGEHAAYQPGQYVTDAPIVEHEIQNGPNAGTARRGVVATDLTYEQARAIDPYAHAKDDGFFIGERHVSRPENYEEPQAEFITPSTEGAIDAERNRSQSEDERRVLSERDGGDGRGPSAEASGSDRVPLRGERGRGEEEITPKEEAQVAGSEASRVEPPVDSREQNARAPFDEAHHAMQQREIADREEGLAEMRSKNITPSDLPEADVPGVASTERTPAELAPKGAVRSMILPISSPRVESMIGHSVMDVADAVGAGAKWAKRLTRGLQRLLNPVGEADMQTRNVMTTAPREKLKAESIADAMFNHAERAVNRYYTRGQKIEMLDRIEHGRSTGSPDLDRFVKAGAKMLKQAKAVEEQFVDVGTPEAKQYWGRFWRKAPFSDDVSPNVSARATQGKRPMQGKGGQYKHRSIDYAVEGYRAGGEMMSDNPFTLLKMRLAEGAKWHAWADTWEKMKDHGIATFVLKGEIKDLPEEMQTALANRFVTEMPEGFKPVDPNLSSVYTKKTERVDAEHGYWAVQEPAYNLMKNMLARDVIRDTMTGRGLLEVKNFYTAVRLASGFHAAFTAGSATDMQIHRAMQMLYSATFHPSQAGQYLRALKANLAPSAVTDVYLGSKVKELVGNWDTKDAYLASPAGEYLMKTMSKIAPGVDVEHMVDLMFHAGISIKSGELVRMKAIEAATEAFRQDRVLAGLVHTPGAAAEAMMYPIMELQVPNEKVGAFMKEFGLRRMQLADDIADGRISEEEIARDVGRYLENTFGQVAYDFNFFHPVVKTVAQIVLNSPGWKLGNIRNLLGAAPAQAKEIGRAIRGQRMPNIDPRVTWGVAMLARTMATSALITMATTPDHRMPKNLMEWIFPVASQVGERVSHYMPLSYAADYISAFESAVKNPFFFPGEWMMHSLSGPLAKSMEVVQNEDYYHNEIYDRHDTRLEAIGKALGHIIMPDNLVASNVLEARRRAAGGGLGERTNTPMTAWYSPENIKLLSLAYSGLGRPAPAHIERTPAQNFLAEQSRGSRQEAPYTPEQQIEFANAVGYKAALEEARKSGRPIDHQALLDQYHLTPQRAKAITKAMGTPQGETDADHDLRKFAHLEQMRDAEDYWALANPAEQKNVQAEFAKKIAKSDRLMDYEKQNMYLRYGLTPPQTTLKQEQAKQKEVSQILTFGPDVVNQQEAEKKGAPKNKSGAGLQIHISTPNFKPLGVRP